MRKRNNRKMKMKNVYCIQQINQMRKSKMWGRKNINRPNFNSKKEKRKEGEKDKKKNGKE